MSEYAGVTKIISPKSFRSPDARSTFPWWLSTIVVLGAVLMIMGGLMALLQPSRLVCSRRHHRGCMCLCGLLCRTRISAGHFSSAGADLTSQGDAEHPDAAYRIRSNGGCHH